MDITEGQIYKKFFNNETIKIEVINHGDIYYLCNKTFHSLNVFINEHRINNVNLSSSIYSSSIINDLNILIGDINVGHNSLNDAELNHAKSQQWNNIKQFAINKEIICTAAIGLNTTTKAILKKLIEYEIIIIKQLYDNTEYSIKEFEGKIFNLELQIHELELLNLYLKNDNIILKEKVRKNDIEIYYLKLTNNEKRVKYNYQEIKQKNKNLNQEFKRVYKLISKNIGFNLIS